LNIFEQAFGIIVKLSTLIIGASVG